MSRLKELEDKIVYHKALYYQGRPEIADHEYDSLEAELKNLAPSSPVLETVGTVVTTNAKVKHQTKMLSLNKTYKIDELVSWKADYDIVSMFKIDGVSCSLIYEDGKLNIAKTRGDGTAGENITSKVLWTNSIPKEISLKHKVEVRGELYCTEEDFFHLSDEMVSIGLDKPSSQRNIVAGLIGRKENLELCRYLTFKAFELIEDELNLKTEMDKHNTLVKNEFSVLDIHLHKNAKDIEKTIDEAKEFMAEGNFQIDGLVCAYNDLALHRELGETAHHPRYKMAFKFMGESKKTRIEEIIWQVSRNGILTPVGNVEAVELSGAKISRVTLHNYGLVRQYELKAGDEIEIIRSGEVIPKFLSVVKSSSNEFIIPDKCPSCDEEVFIEDIRIVCKNIKCPAIVKESILNFIQKIGIDDLSSKRLEEMMNNKLISGIEDLYKLKAEQLLNLDKVKDKLANKLIASIDKSKGADLITFLSALGISGGAYNKCEKVVRGGFDSIDKLKNITVEKLMEVDSFAEKSSYEFVKSFKEKIELVDILIEYGFSFEEVVKAQTEITDKKICITGSLSEKRSVIESRIRDAGGITVSSVTKNTDLLLTNETEAKSSKYKKAVSLGIEIISEENLLKKI
jgi:DNA ligase (NAD+)